MPPKNTGPGTINNPAIEVYERLLKCDTPYKQLAEERIAALRTATAQDFNAWFALQNPKPADRAMPKDLEHSAACPKTSVRPANRAARQRRRRPNPRNRPPRARVRPRHRQAGKSAAPAPAKPNSKSQSGPALPAPALK